MASSYKHRHKAIFSFLGFYTMFAVGFNFIALNKSLNILYRVWFERLVCIARAVLSDSSGKPIVITKPISQFVNV